MNIDMNGLGDAILVIHCMMDRIKLALHCSTLLSTVVNSNIIGRLDVSFTNPYELPGISFYNINHQLFTFLTSSLPASSTLTSQ